MNFYVVFELRDAGECAAPALARVRRTVSSRHKPTWGRDRRSTLTSTHLSIKNSTSPIRSSLVSASTHVEVRKCKCTARSHSVLSVETTTPSSCIHVGPTMRVGVGAPGVNFSFCGPTLHGAHLNIYCWAHWKYFFYTRKRAPTATARWNFNGVLCNGLYLILKGKISEADVFNFLEFYLFF